MADNRSRGHNSGRSDLSEGGLHQGRENRQNGGFNSRGGKPFVGGSPYGDEGGPRYGERDRHRGRGPRNYTRSDERILEDVNDRLTDDPWLDASGIEVHVASREVTLTGEVETRGDKRRAEDLAYAVSGIAHVQNNLRVRSRPGVVATDEEGARRALPTSSLEDTSTGQKSTLGGGARSSSDV